MRSVAILLTTVVLLVTGLSVPSRAQPGPKGPCAEIREACLRAGFVPNGARSGIGVAFDCIQPIMTGTLQPPRAARPLPPINPELVAACRASNPSFGLGQRAALGPEKQPPYPGSKQGLPPSGGPPPGKAMQGPQADGLPPNDSQRQQAPPVEAPPLSQGPIGQAPPRGAPSGEPCTQISAACTQAGFVPNGAKSGYGIQLHCIRPIMAGTPPPPGAARALPQIDPRVVAACRASNPTFGQGPNYVGPLSGASSYGGVPPSEGPLNSGVAPPQQRQPETDVPPTPGSSANSGVARPPQVPPGTGVPATPASSANGGVAPQPQAPSAAPPTQGRQPENGEPLL
jgi:hypothetical protein